jgi:glycosyltransferase involved in cell wall biosynthesis
VKIAFLNDGAYAYASGAPGAVGGSERDQWLLSAALAKFGWSVVVGVRELLQPGERKRVHDVEFIGIERGHILLSWYRFLSSENPDWWYWECATHLWGAAVELAKLSRVRTIFAVGFDSEVEPRRALNYRERWWPLYAWGLQRTDRIFAQHQGQISRLPRSLQSRAYILRKVCLLPGLVGDEALPTPHVERRSYVAWIGMLRRHKRPDRLVEIARSLPNVRFVVCGGVSTTMTPPGYSEDIIRNFRELRNVEYLGQVEPRTAHEVIANAALLLSTSDAEGFPNTFVQAWSSGTPVISLEVDPDHIIERAGLGALSGTVQGAIADIEKFLASTSLRDQIARRARKFIVQNNSAAAVVRSFERALQGFS